MNNFATPVFLGALATSPWAEATDNNAWITHISDSVTITCHELVGKWMKMNGENINAKHCADVLWDWLEQEIKRVKEDIKRWLIERAEWTMTWFDCDVSAQNWPYGETREVVISCDANYI